MEKERNYISLWKNPVIGATIGGVAGGLLGYFTRENYVPAVQTVAPLIMGGVFALAGSLFGMAYDFRERKDREEK